MANSTLDLITYWFYEGSKCIGSVRAESGSTDNVVRLTLIEQETNFPLGHHEYETPAEYRNRLRRATLKTFDESGSTETVYRDATVRITLPTYRLKPGGGLEIVE